METVIFHTFGAAGIGTFHWGKLYWNGGDDPQSAERLSGCP